MRKLLAAGLALSVLAGGATAASAQNYGRQDYREDRREARQDAREDRRDYRQDRREYRQEARQDARRYRRAERRYQAGRYTAPRGYAYRQWSYGQRLPAGYYDGRYQIRDYGRYGLYAPPRGYVWTRVGDDAILTAVAGGVIGAVVASLFY